MASKAANLKYRYGIELSEYDAMVEQQKCKCKICKTETKTLVVDHCHDSGRVRGLLCKQCNVGIGMLKESENIMREALNYINEHNIKKVGGPKQ